MSSAIYLENYLDGLESLPTELERNFKLMRKLDDRAQTAMKSIDSHAKDFMRKLTAENGAMSEEDRKERLEDIKALFGKAKEYSDDKVQLAIQTYELVDKQIRRLDNDLARFEGEIQEKASSTRAKSEEAVAKKGGRKKTKDAKATGKKKRTASSDEETGRGGGNHSNSASGTNLNTSSSAGQGSKKKKSKKAADVDDSEKESSHTAATHPSDVMDMPVDPNEPTYCLCHQVSYGEMIGCDNPDCPIEWFHFACVGLTTKPKGKWFCPKCTQDRKKK
ncbi:inhibitor of growth protein 5 isoform X2 [Drosophila innubila]|uniref:inhibitor of growth protein 5 isoform X2 n=1 Tax=Drosophila innubila TaxID=198719 RepID=UPI00148B4B5C|nr:inhibitor of growth protein 5 isoform X2 [Drosophila innubila]